MKLISYKKPNINLCLSGGGALGFAHIGAIQALEEHGIRPTRISGASMGAIIGVFYASGHTPSEMLQLVKENKLYKVNKLLTFHADFWKSGMSDHTTLRNLIKRLMPHNSFEGLNKQLFVCVANMTSDRYELIHAGSELDKWIAASASIPGVFVPINSGDSFYLDGGTLNNMPAQCFADEPLTTIGVDVIPYTKLNPPSSIRAGEMALTAIRAMQHYNAREGRAACRYLIEPLVLNKYHEFSFDDYAAIYKIGYDTTMSYISQNPSIVELANPQARLSLFAKD